MTQHLGDIVKHIILYLILFFANTLSLANIDHESYEIATQKYYLFSIERLKNTKEILERLSHKLEAEHYESAKVDYIKAHYQYESIRPLILLYPHINTLVDTHPADLPIDIQDPRFIGFHALEYSLFINQDSARAFVETKKLINNLSIVIRYMQHQQNISMNDMVDLLPAFIQQILNNKLPSKDSWYGEANLGEIAANLEGINLIMHQLHVYLPEPLFKAYEQNESDIFKLLQVYKLDDIYHPYSKLIDSDKKLLENKTLELSTLILQVNNIIKQRNA